MNFLQRARLGVVKLYGVRGIAAKYGLLRNLDANILGSTLGVENTYGALEGRTPAGPLTFGRITTADTDGCIRTYMGEGELTNDSLKTFGNRAVAKIPDLQKLMKHIRCQIIQLG